MQVCSISCVKNANFIRRNLLSALESKVALDIDVVLDKFGIKDSISVLPRKMQSTNVLGGHFLEWRYLA